MTDSHSLSGDSVTGPTTVFWHPSSASTTRADEFRNLIETQTDFRLLTPESEDELEKIIADGIGKPGVFIAAGGDGTVRRTVSAFMKLISQGVNQVADFGVFPLGTGNDLARTLGIPFDAAGAIDVIRNGQSIQMDTFHVETSEGQFWCGNMITGGNTGKYLEHMTDEIKERWGALSYLRGIVDVIQNIETFSIKVTTSEASLELPEVLNLFIANGRTSGGGMIVAPDASLESGEAQIMIIEDGERKEMLKLTADYLMSDYREHPLVSFLRSDSVKIESEPPLSLTADGDLIGTTPLTLNVHRNALRVRVPGQKTPT